MSWGREAARPGAGVRAQEPARTGRRWFGVFGGLRVLAGLRVAGGARAGLARAGWKGGRADPGDPLLRGVLGYLTAVGRVLSGRFLKGGAFRTWLPWMSSAASPGQVRLKGWDAMAEQKAFVV